MTKEKRRRARREKARLQCIRRAWKLAHPEEAAPKRYAQEVEACRRATIRAELIKARAGRRAAKRAAREKMDQAAQDSAKARAELRARIKQGRRGLPRLSTLRRTNGHQTKRAA